MTLLEFEQQREIRPCTRCGVPGVVLERSLNNNGVQVVCPACGSRSPWGATLFLKQSDRKRRPPLPGGKTLDDVWTDYGDRCVSCGQSRDTLLHLGIGRHAHHVLPYARHGHDGPVVPLCALCHQMVNALQRVMSRLIITRENQLMAPSDEAAVGRCDVRRLAELD